MLAGFLVGLVATVGSYYNVFGFSFDKEESQKSEDGSFPQCLV